MHTTFEFWRGMGLEEVSSLKGPVKKCNKKPLIKGQVFLLWILSKIQ